MIMFQYKLISVIIFLLCYFQTNLLFSEIENKHLESIKQFKNKNSLLSQDIDNIISETKIRFIYICLNKIENKYLSINQKQIYSMPLPYLTTFKMWGHFNSDDNANINIESTNNLSRCFKEEYSNIGFISKESIPK